MFEHWRELVIHIFVCEDNNEQRQKFTKIIEDIIMIQWVLLFL